MYAGNVYFVHCKFQIFPLLPTFSVIAAHSFVHEAPDIFLLGPDKMLLTCLFQKCDSCSPIPAHVCVCGCGCVCAVDVEALTSAAVHLFGIFPKLLNGRFTRLQLSLFPLSLFLAHFFLPLNIPLICSDTGL
ncbi:hypothetical protein XENORESO_004278 [Xenotaenia resolanae]|uniref:Uncharacterized protein n=1 Tax=Xenotaenia resolanae TaxID=208358 RepID=A0ABV0WUZ6_9TELE